MIVPEKFPGFGLNDQNTANVDEVDVDDVDVDDVDGDVDGDKVDEFLLKLNELEEDINDLGPDAEADAPTPAANKPAPTTDSEPSPEGGGGGGTLDDVIAGAPGVSTRGADTSAFDENG